jgi:hypothetical protein
MASRVTGFGACGTGIALLVAVLIGETASTSPNYWCGLWWPDTHPERTAKRAERDQQALFARYARRDALRELMDELEGNRRDVGIELVNKRTYGVSYPGTAWAKNQHDEPGLEKRESLSKTLT